MANARIHDYTFLIDPTTASWGYTMNVKQYDTYGGRVLQTLSCKIDRLTIGGYLKTPKGDVGRYDHMHEFEKAVVSIMEYHSATKSPVWFDYPALGWSAWVWLMGYKDVKYDVATAAVSYSLTLEVENGFDTLLTTAESYGLDLINSGVEYVRNEFNTPNVTWADLRTAYEKLLDDAGTIELLDSIYDYLDQKDSEGADGSTANQTPTSIQGAAAQGASALVSNMRDVVLRGSTVNTDSDFYKMYGARTGGVGK